MVDSAARPRDALPSISHLDLDAAKSDRIDYPRIPLMAALSVSTAPHTSPTNMYSGPPPLYSYASSLSAPGQHLSGYISPPEPTRPGVQEEHEPVAARQSLPSISEALGQDKAMDFGTSTTTLPPSGLSHQHPPTPSSTVGHSFPEPPMGPSNPFSQPAANSSVVREHGSKTEADVVAPSFAALNATEPRPRPTSLYPATHSPTAPSGPAHNSSLPSSMSNGHAAPPNTSPTTFAPYRSPFAFSNHASNAPLSVFTPSVDPFRSATAAQAEEQKRLPPKNGMSQSYGESVKRHLDVFDTQLALHEVAELSANSHDFARAWLQRAQQSSRPGYYPEPLPEMHEVEDVLRQSNRVVENLLRIKEAVVAQQAAIAEQRARAAKGEYGDDEFNGLPDEYKGASGYAGGEAKKRRGKAAPPGRCHSCNRAETPEWRRGPDGARTLCNACGLHYAKLTRKMGVNKASLAGSNLRPKNHDPRSPHG